MSKKFAVLLDDKRVGAVKGSGLENQIDSLFGGALKAFILDIPDDEAKKIMGAFDTARVDSRGYITDTPIAFNRVLFEEIAKAKSLGAEVIAGVLAREKEIKELAAKESDYLPAPDF
jgi:hypothetical protein